MNEPISIESLRRKKKERTAQERKERDYEEIAQKMRSAIREQQKNHPFVHADAARITHHTGREAIEIILKSSEEGTNHLPGGIVRQLKEALLELQEEYPLHAKSIHYGEPNDEYGTLPPGGRKPSAIDLSKPKRFALRLFQSNGTDLKGIMKRHFNDFKGPKAEKG